MQFSNKFTTAFDNILGYKDSYVLGSFRKVTKDFNTVQGMFLLKDDTFEEVCSLVIDRACRHVHLYYNRSTTKDCMTRAKSVYIRTRRSCTGEIDRRDANLPNQRY